MNEAIFDITIMKHGKEIQLVMPAPSADAAYAQAKQLAEGKIYTDDLRILDLGQTPYQMIDVRLKEEAKPSVQIEAPAPQLENANGLTLFPFVNRVEFLGEKVEIKGVRTTYNDTGFIVIYEIAGSPAQTVYGKKSLEELTYYVGESFGYSNHVSLLPEGDLTDVEAAIEYVEDYVAETIEIEKKKRADRNKTATAFSGFTEKV